MTLEGPKWLAMSSKWAHFTCSCTPNGLGWFLENYIFDPFLVPKQPIFKAFWDFRRAKAGHDELETRQKQLFAKGGGNTLHQITTNHVTQTGCARHQTVPEGAALPIVSHSPRPEGGSCRHLPPRLGGDNTRQANVSQSPRGWAGGQTNKGRNYLNLGSGCGWGWEGVGQTCTVSGTPGTRPTQLDGATLPATNTHHAALPSSPPVPHPVPTAPPVGGWVGGQKTA